MSSDSYALTGIQDGLEEFNADHPRKVPLRLEIDQFWMSEDPVHVRQRTLFIRALLYIQNILPTEKDKANHREGRFSFYQIAGIHGQPYVRWDGGPDRKRGYCKHAQTLFATWHRPYGLLLEQVLFEVMRDVLIPEYAEKDRPALLEAARQWRFPFWDWATKKRSADEAESDYNIPRLIRLHEVQVLMPGGWTWVPNPFHTFKIPRKLTFGSKELGDWALAKNLNEQDSNRVYRVCRATSRHPLTINQNSPKWTDGSQNNEAIMYEIRDQKWTNGGSLTSGLREQVYHILAVNKYTSFASTRLRPNEGIYNSLSLEGIHNSMHNFIGGGAVMTPDDDHNFNDKFERRRPDPTGDGNDFRKFFASGFMSDPAVAAFDPIFWLHHYNVDRLLAIWQAMHPKESQEWFESSSTAKEALLPFNQKGGQSHSSETVASTNKLGYAYPELQLWLPQFQTNGKFDSLKMQKHVTEEVKALYYSSQKAAELALRTESIAEPLAVTIESLAVTPAIERIEAPKVTEILSSQISTANSKKTSVFQNGEFQFNDYLVSVKFKRFGLGGRPFSVHFFIGPVPPPPFNFSEQTTQVAMVYNFASALPSEGQAGCDNCVQQADDGLEIADAKILTNALITRWKQKILHSDDAGDYLESMEPEAVAAFLKKHLHWRVTTLDGREVRKDRDAAGRRLDPRFDALSLKVAVAVGRVRHYEDPAKMSDYGEYKILYDVTADSSSGSGITLDDGLFTSNPPFEPTA